MRWDRVFEEIELQAHDVAAEERDALADDLAAETWRRTTWHDLLVGDVQMQVAGAGLIRGEVTTVAELIEVQVAGLTSWVEPSAVMSVVTPGRRRRETPTVLTWRSQLGEAFSSRVRIWDRLGTSHEGLLVNVGQDFLQIAVGMQRREVITPRAAISMVTLLEQRH